MSLGLRHHAWVKVKLHNYVCRKCGARKVNVDTGPRGWIAEWHLPDGTVERMRLAPPCVEGPQTAERLAWLADHERQGLTAERAANAGDRVEGPTSTSTLVDGASSALGDAGERPAPVTPAIMLAEGRM